MHFFPAGNVVKSRIHLQKNARWGLFMRVYFVCLQVDGPINRVVWGGGGGGGGLTIIIGSLRYLYDAYDLHFLAETV